MYWKIAAVLGLSAAAVTLVEYFLYLQRLKLKEVEKLRALERVIFFDDTLQNCREHLTTENSCGDSCSFKKLSYLIARIDDCLSTLDLCMFLMTCHNLSSALARAVERGVKVRMLYDHDMAGNTHNYGCQIRWLRRHGVEVRTRPYAHHMHHKFVVLDGRLAITGSANWTLQAFCGNWENVVVTADPRLVHQFADTFQELWDMFTEALPESA
ncbi:uncharacterized protein LOC134538330 [Bacillus rossius redtenbacheri]|uniref:uncharacterized protein LOC134538330 n=1 Tax=Bacillus rossius redtenbacheri TaxID=93214 RepID=UPI002FDEC334